MVESLGWYRYLRRCRRVVSRLRMIPRHQIVIQPTRPCEGKNVNVCIAEGCFNEACIREVVMPTDPNARLLKAIEDLTRELKENNRQLKKIARSAQVSSANPYLEGNNATSAVDSTTGPYGVGPLPF